MKKCPFCKKEIDDKAFYCPHCGKNVSEAIHSSALNAPKEESLLPLLLSGLSLAFVIFPFLGFALSIVTFAMSFPKRKESSVSFDSFLFSIFAILFNSVMLVFVIINLVTQLRGGA